MHVFIWKMLTVIGLLSQFMFNVIYMPHAAELGLVVLVLALLLPIFGLFVLYTRSESL